MSIVRVETVVLETTASAKALLRCIAHTQRMSVRMSIRISIRMPIHACNSTTATAAVRPDGREQLTECHICDDNKYVMTTGVP